ncbi:signal peptidase I [Peptoniphilus equinus]|uniref:Signal peptidase I n=1 Tax=Peptoniphilus equinus TaxID=3016343 RepID=A0ABY7QTR0_9FIRM|nr:signal peptidase I [Peptoniphilus equinus]WBW49841.1 signal peptidase I [Peptoniphilus equinus]
MNGFGWVVAAFVLAGLIWAKGHLFRVVGNSMSPTLNHGDLLKVRTAVPSQLSRGTLVIFVLLGQTQSYLKRIVAVAGDEVLVVGDHVFVTEGPHNRPITPVDGGCVFRLKSGELYVLGDNRDASKDSRHFGPIRVGDVTHMVDRRLVGPKT